MSHHAIRCSKCLYHERFYQAPLGKVVRNQYAKMALRETVYDTCGACEGTGYVPSIILEAIEKAFPRKAEEIFTQLRWSGDHWSFTLAGMYVGVESDGYIHT